MRNLSSSCLSSISTPYASKGLYLESQTGYHTLSSEAYGFVARIDGSGNFQVLLSDRYFNKTCGLCGDFNIFSEDDFKTQEGKLSWDALSGMCGFPAHELSLGPLPGHSSLPMSSPPFMPPTFSLSIPPHCLDPLSCQTLGLLRPDLVQL